MDSSDSSSDDDNIYTNAAVKLKAWNKEIKCKTKTVGTTPKKVENSTNAQENNLEKHTAEVCQQVEVETTETLDAPVTEVENSSDIQIEVSPADLSESPVICVGDVSDNSYSPRRITRRSSKRKSPRSAKNLIQNIVNSPRLEAIIDLNDSIERELNELNDDSLNLSQENDSYVLIGSPVAKKSNNEDNYEVSIKVLWKSNEIIRFEIRRNETFQKIFLHFAELEGVSENQIIISRKEKRINRFDTPASINARITDIYEGGVVSAEMMKKLKGNLTQDQMQQEDMCKIKVQTSDKKTIVVNMKHDAPFTFLLQNCAEQLNVPMSSLKFYFDGEMVENDETPESLDIEEEACFDLKIVE